MSDRFNEPEITSFFLEKVIAGAPRAFVGEPTHRASLFYRNAASSSDDVIRKVLLNKVGPYWVSEAGSVWYADDHHRLYFNLPLITNGDEVIRNGDRSIFELGELNPYEIKELTGEPARQWTPQEMSQIFLDHAKAMTKYWETVELDPSQSDKPEIRHRLEGLLFSMLSLLDGSSVNIPGFHLVSSASVEDREFDEKLGNNWWPVHDVPEEVQLAWPLHEIYSTAKAT